MDRFTPAFYPDIVGKYWPVEIKNIENKYEDIPFPFAQIDAHDFHIDLEWSLRDLEGYFYVVKRSEAH